MVRFAVLRAARHCLAVFLCPYAMSTQKRNYFYNDGDGWFCRRCIKKLDSLSPSDVTNGQGAVEDPDIADPRLARWMDRTRRTLICPTCGVTELMDLF
jgi:hypothetical protein